MSARSRRARRLRRAEERRRAAAEGVTVEEVRLADDAVGRLRQPPLFAVLVSGGKLRDESAEKVRRYVEEQTRGGSFHKVLVLEVDDPRVRVEVLPARVEVLPAGSAP